MRRLLLLIVLSLTIACHADDNVKRPESYNYLRGVEAIQNNNLEEAADYLNKELQENPKNGYALSWIAMIRASQEDYGRALTSADLAIKYLPKKDVEYVTFAYTTRADVYLNLEDTVKALTDYAAAIKINPDDSRLYEKRAQVYYEQGKYNISDVDYRKMVELKPGDVMGYMGVGRNANAQKRWDDAIKQFDYVIKLNAAYSSAYSFRAESYVGLGKWNEATDDIVTALGIDWDRKAMFLAYTLTEPAFTMLVSKIKIQSAKSPNESTWPYIAGTMYEHNKQYEKAIEYYKTANDKDASASILLRISMCNYRAGNYGEALSCINQAINMDSTELAYIRHRANIYYEMGKVKFAIAEWDKVLAAQPEDAFGYYRRGWFKVIDGDYDGAVEDLSMSIVLDPQYSYAYGTRGDVYLKQGKKKLAEDDFKKVIEIEKTPDDYEYIHYAYEGLGLYEEAKAAMDSIIAHTPDDAGNYYDAACLYSKMKDKNNALRYLEKSLELGFNRFAHIERDSDLDFIRNTPEFQKLIRKNKPRLASLEGNDGLVAVSIYSDVDTKEVPFTKEDGVCKVKCQINGLPLYFVFDTGASSVTLSMVEATFMMKNGYLTGNDVVGSQQYMDANGDISVGTVINLKKVDFGGLELNNVRASVVRNQKAPLLLGQSVLGRLGKIEIDNHKRVLKITSSTF